MSTPSPVQRYLPTLGLQVWTVRDQLAHDIPGTLRAIRDAGYAQIELMRTLDAREIVPAARDLGLQVTSAFVDWEMLAKPETARPGDAAAHLAVARELGLRFLVFGYIGKGLRETAAQIRAHAATCNAFGRQCHDAGVRFCYHHHSFEFSPLTDGRTTAWDIFVQEFDPRFVHFELDVFWLTLGGLDPVRTLHDLRGRVPQVHLKDVPAGTPRHADETTIPPENFCELGAGVLDFNRILEACRDTGVEQCHAEQDQSPDPLASIARSHAFLRRL